MDITAVTAGRPVAIESNPVSRVVTNPGSSTYPGSDSATAASGSGGGASSAGVSLPDLKAAITAGSKALQGLNQSLEFQIDPDSKQSVVKVVDTETNQVIQQIPSREFLQMAQNIEAFQAQLIRDKA
jgi:flagellar protein FlaG